MHVSYTAKPCDPGAMVAPVSSDVIVQQDDDGERASRLVSYLKAQDGPQVFNYW